MRSTTAAWHRIASVAILLQIALTGASVAQVQPLFKCQTGTTVTYQQTPCVSAAPRRVVTAEQLNAERRSRDRDREPAASATGLSARSVATTPPPAAVAASPLPSSTARFRCDGRRRCAQMTSCEEAKFFLAYCPGVEMDGDHDGIPCEQQWCH